MRRFGSALVAAAVVLGLSGCASPNPSPSPDHRFALSSAELVLGVVGSTDRVGSADSGPLSDLLAASTGKRVEVVQTRDDSGLRQAAGAGQVDLGIFSALSYLTLVDSGAPLVAVAAEVPAGSTAAETTTRVVVAPNSPLRDLDNLSGRTLCVGPSGSLEGSLVARYALSQAGVNIDLVRVASDADIVAGVTSGQCDAGVVTAPSALQSEAGSLEGIATLSVPSRVVAISTRLPAGVRSAAARALAAAMPSDLAAKKITLPPEFTARLSGYLPITPSFFAPVRQMCAVPELKEECAAS